MTLFVLEWNQPFDEIEKFGAMLAEMCEWNCWFAWSEGMVSGFGLIENDAALAAIKQLGGNTMAKLEDAEKQADWSLGPRWRQNGQPMPIETRTNGERVGYYTDGVGIEKNGEIWPLVAANKESLIPLLERYGFRLVPA